MKSHRIWRLGSLGMGALAVMVWACGGSEGAGSSESGVTDGDGLTILFPRMYSAHDGTREYKLPAIVEGVKKVRWSASDPSMVDLESQADGSVMITTRKPGKVTITAKSGSLEGSAELTITAAKEGEWNAGNERYNNGVVLKRGGGRDGGGWEAGASDPQRKQAACTNCHGHGGSEGDVEHTPMQTAGFSDDELVAIFTKGQKPPGVEQRIMKLERWQKIHQWEMDEFAAKGLVVYLRSLEPKSQGTVDWGGKGGKGGGGGKGGDRGDGGPARGEPEPQ